MLDFAMKAITRNLNNYMHQAFDLDEDLVILSVPFDSDGNMASEVNNKVVIFLSNINKDSVPISQSSSGLSSSSFQSAKPLFLNLYVMVAACFDAAKYQEALKFLSHAILCFQENPVIDRNSNVDLPSGIDKLILDIENVGINELSNLWGILGGRYLPSILYKVRMVVLASDGISYREIAAMAPESTASKY